MSLATAQLADLRPCRAPAVAWIGCVVCLLVTPLNALTVDVRLMCELTGGCEAGDFFTIILRPWIHCDLPPKRLSHLLTICSQFLQAQPGRPASQTQTVGPWATWLQISRFRLTRSSFMPVGTTWLETRWEQRVLEQRTFRLTEVRVWSRE